MEGQEKIMAVGIAAVFLFLSMNLISQLFVSDYYTYCSEQQSYGTPEYSECLEWGRENAELHALLQTIISIGVSVAVLGLGLFVIKNNGISNGLMAGAIFLMIQSSGLFFVSMAERWEKTVMFAVVFAILIALAYFKVSKEGPGAVK